MRKAVSFVCACLMLCAIAFVTVSPIDWRPHDVFGVNEDRALAFAILGGLFTAAHPRRWRFVALGTVIIAGGLEIMQLFSETRHARVADALVKASGAFSGIGLALACRQVWFMFVAQRNRTHKRRGSRNATRISAVVFDQTDGSLRLRFSNGEERLFAGVDEGAVTGLLQTHEPMQYYRTHIEPRFERRVA